MFSRGGAIVLLRVASEDDAKRVVCVMHNFGKYGWGQRDFQKNMLLRKSDGNCPEGENRIAWSVCQPIVGLESAGRTLAPQSI
jgi:hypothetical protein